ncbi:MAG: hypothetical protein J6C32_09155 [Eubacterium sp.]|nr:hypothetical protein [Eubacterium sp.]
MRKKIVMAGICMAVLFTGCGMPDAVADELERVSPSAGMAVYGEWQRDAFVGAVTEAEEHAEGTMVAVSQKTAERMEKLGAFLEKAMAEGLIDAGDGDGEEDMDEDETGVKDLKNWRTFAEDKTCIFMGSSSGITASFSVAADKIKEFLNGMTGIGFTGLAVPAKNEEDGYSEQVSQGMNFTMNYASDGEDEDYGSTGKYDITVEVPVYSLVYPEKYRDLLDAHMKNAFCLSAVFCGGDLELVSFTGSRWSPVNQYTKRAEVIFKDGKPLQMNITIDEGFRGKEGELFTEAEKEDLTGLITWMTGDQERSADFVENLGKSKEKSGTIGNRKWYRQEKWSAMAELIRFQ